MKLKPWVKYLLAPDNGGPSASPSAAPAEAPTAPTDTTKEEPKLDMPSTEDIAAELAAVDEPKAPDATKTKPDEPKKPTDDLKKPEAEKPKGDVKGLRENYERTKTELATAQTEKAVLQKERDELAAKLKDFETGKVTLEKERDEYKNAGEEHYKRLLFHEPEVAKEFKALDDALNSDLEQPFSTIPGLAKAYGGLLSSYSKLPWGTKENPEKHAEFRAELKEQFPDDWKDVESALNRGVKHLREEGALRTRLQTESREFQHSKRVETWQKYGERFDGNAKSFFAVDPEAVKSDPYNPVAFVAEIGAKDPKVGDFLKQATEFAKNVYLGPKPLSSKDLAGLNDEQIGERMAKAVAAHEGNRDNAVKMIARGLAYEALFRPLLGKVKKLEALVAELKGAEPPAPNADGTKPSDRPSEMPSTADVARDIQAA